MTMLGDPSFHAARLCFVPALVRRELSREPDAALPLVGAGHAAVLFADISGFTSLSERLAHRGPAGIEELSERLNRWFGDLVDLIYAHGSDVLKFAGDSLLAAWVADVGESPDATCTRAAACGLEVAWHLGHGHAAEGVPLSLKLGLGVGELRWMHLGDVADQRELFVAGEPLRQVALPQRAAGTGDLVLSPEAWARVAAGARGESREEGCASLSELVSPPPPKRLPAPPLGTEANRSLAAYVPVGVRTRLDAGQAAWLAELRQVSVVFVRLPHLDEHTPPAEAQTVVSALLSLCKDQEATLNKLSVDDKGASVLVVLGLPPLAHHDDPRRALELARAISTTLAAQACRHSVGVASGRVFCGTVGSPSRREYTVLGGAVNLAARLMVAGATHPEIQALPVLCDETTARAVTGRAPTLPLRPLAPVPLKGMARSVAVHAIEPQTATGGAPAGSSGIPLVGRQAERAVIEKALDALCEGRGGLILFEGEAGIGKTRLIEHLRERADARGLPLLRAEADTVDRKRSYGVWRPVAEALLGAVDPAIAGGGASLVSTLEDHDPEMATLAPLLQAFLPLGLSDNAYTADLSGEIRADHTRRALLTLLRIALGEGPIVLLVEDARWMDSASWSLLAWLWSARDRLLVVVSTRPIPEPQPANLRTLRADPRFDEHRLLPLTEADSLELAARFLGLNQLPPALARLVAERAEGHPFFSEELVWTARDTGMFRIEDGRCELAVNEEPMNRLSLPETLQGAITARIDRLGPSQQLTVKVARVIGRTFSVTVLDGIHPIEAARAQLYEDLAILGGRNLIRLLHPGPEEMHTFEHALTRDAAYELLPFAQRRRLHRAVARYLERAPEDRGPHLVPRLAHHWLRSLDARAPEAEAGERARDYLECAAEQAMQEYANEEAVGFLEEALALDARLDHPEKPLRRARWERWLGLAYLRLGRMPASGDHLERAIAILDRPVPGTPGLLRYLLGESWFQARFQLGITGEPEPEDARAIEAAYASLFVVRYQANQALQTVYAALRGLRLAIRGASVPQQAAGLATLCLIVGTAPLHTLARRYARQALERAERAGEPGSLAWVLVVIGVYAIGTGRWESVERHLTRAATIAERTGNGRRWEETNAVLAWHSYLTGRPAQAAERCRTVARAAQQRRDPQPRIWGLCGVVEAGWVAGEKPLEGCLELLDEARRRLPHDIYRAEAIRNLGVSAVMMARADDLEEARQAVVEVTETARGLVPTTFYSFEGYAGAVEVLLGLEAVADSETRGPPEVAHRHAWRALSGFARVFPIARPRRAWLGGLRHWNRNRRRMARRHRLAGLAQARTMGMPLEELRLQAALALDGDPTHTAAAAAQARSLDLDATRFSPWWSTYRRTRP